MARELHVYLDESGRRIDHGQVLLVGALVLQEPLGFRSGAWFTDLLEHPHATEIPNDHIRAAEPEAVRSVVSKATICGHDGLRNQDHSNQGDGG